VDWQNALFAPGWLWSVVSTVLVVASLIGLYRQLRMQSAQGAWEQLEAMEANWRTGRMDRAKLDVLRALRDRPDWADVPPGAANLIGAYWERIGALVHAGHVNPRLLHSFVGGACAVWWVGLAPYVRKRRIDIDDPTEMEHFERLAASMSELDRRRGARAFDEALLRSQLTTSIARYEEDLARHNA
jgi:hypothetical protein